MLPGIYKVNSLVDLADFAPNVPCGGRTCVLRMLGSREALLRTVFACSDWELSPLAFAQIGRITLSFIELEFRKIVSVLVYLSPDAVRTLSNKVV